jgi:monofunctional biosynthetic peptidoglycan transglycosylase
MFASWPSRRTIAAKSPRRTRSSLGRRLAIAVLAIFIAMPAAGVLLYGVVPPPMTPLMFIRLFEGEGLDRQWRPRTAISPDLFRAVVAAEDARFCEHFGFDRIELQKAIEEWRRGHRLRGASTITMQTAKNLFLWPGRLFLRKAAEAYLTPWLEIGWSKARILEIYVNIVEWGPGIYGAEAASRYYFDKPASKLTANEASLLAAVLPNPREWSPAKPSAYIRERARMIRAQMAEVPISGSGICIAQSVRP